MNTIPDTVISLRNVFESGITKPLEYRETQLRNLYRMLEVEEQLILEALAKDGGKSLEDEFMLDLNAVKNGIASILSQMRYFFEPKPIKLDMLFLGDSCEERNVPFGVVLIIGTWNYVLQATLLPLLGAIAGGNTACIKFSEIAPNIGILLSKLMPKYLDMTSIALVMGAVPEATLLLEQKFDLIFFVGNITVGKIVMEAAAKNLTPVILELGGKAPAIVDETSCPQIAARRIIWGKIVNCGQTCIAPDYVLIHESIGKKFIESLKDWASKITGGDCFQDKNYARIISKRHFDRLKDLMEKQLAIKETVLLYGGATREVDNCIEPTILLLRGENIHNQPIMKDEIFGPILPVIFYKDLNEALSFVKKVYGFGLHSGKNPLALYPFSRNDSTLERIISEINAGMVTTNDVLMQGQILNFPFGGTGNSGIGAYHGIHSLKAFTRPLGILKRVVATDIANFPRYRLIYHSKVAFKMIKYFLVTPLQSDFSTKTKFYLWKYGITKFSFYMFLVLFGYYYGKNY